MVDGKEGATIKAGCGSGVLQGSLTPPSFHLKTLRLCHAQHGSVPGTVACCQLLHTSPGRALAWLQHRHCLHEGGHGVSAWGVGVGAPHGRQSCALMWDDDGEVRKYCPRDSLLIPRPDSRPEPVIAVLVGF